MDRDLPHPGNGHDRIRPCYRLRRFHGQGCVRRIPVAHSCAHGPFDRLGSSGSPRRTMAKAACHAGTNLDHLRRPCQALQAAWTGDFKQICIRRPRLIAGEYGSS